MRQLTVVPHGGLCNRLRVLLSALHLCRESESLAVEVVWDKNAECAADFDELFVPITQPHFSVRCANFALRPVTRFNIHLPALLRLPRYGLHQFALFHPKHHGDIRQHLNHKNRLYVSTPYPLCDYPPVLAKELQPVKTIVCKVEDAMAKLYKTGRPVLGVHIRRTDNERAKAVSTLADFTRGIAQFIADNPKGSVFLASDETEAIRIISKEYPDRCFYNLGADLKRNTKAGIIQAVADLYTLARCDRILGSYWSSFTDMAAEIGNIPLEIAGQRPKNTL